MERGAWKSMRKGKGGGEAVFQNVSWETCMGLAGWGIDTKCEWASCGNEMLLIGTDGVVVVVCLDGERVGDLWMGEYLGNDLGRTPRVGLAQEWESRVVAEAEELTGSSWVLGRVEWSLLEVVLLDAPPRILARR